jgi:tyrosyl-tRNA synthetase
MTLYEELVARGLIAQVTNEEQIRSMINAGKATFYIGFDCTADSLTAGHFMALTLMKRLQMAGNRPIALIGGGTTMIGDPSGRTDMRKMLTREDIDHNAAVFRRQMERFIEFGEGQGHDGQQRRLAAGPELRGAAAGGGDLLFREQHAPGRVLQAAHGAGPFLL